MPHLRALFRQRPLLAPAIAILTLAAIALIGPAGCGSGGAGGGGGPGGLIPSSAASLSIHAAFFSSVSEAAEHSRLAGASRLKTFPGSPQVPPPFIETVRFTVGIPGDPSAITNTFQIVDGATLDFTIGGLQAGSNILFTAEALDVDGRVHFRDGQTISLVPGGITDINVPFFPLAQLDASTFGGGLIAQDSIMLSGTYNITQTINVTVGHALIIDRATTLFMNPGTKIIVNGVLRSEGRHADPVFIVPAGSGLAGAGPVTPLGSLAAASTDPGEGLIVEAGGPPPPTIVFSGSRFATPAIRSALLFTRVAGFPGGVLVSDSDCDLINDLFDFDGSAVTINTTSTSVIRRCAFISGGGGIGISVTDSSDVSIDDNILVGQNVGSTGVSLVRSPVTMTHNKIAGYNTCVGVLDSGATIVANWIRGGIASGIISSQSGPLQIALEPHLLSNNITDCGVAVNGNTGGAILGAATVSAPNFIARRGAVVSGQDAFPGPGFATEPDGTLGNPTVPVTITGYITNVDVVFDSSTMLMPGANSSDLKHGIGFAGIPPYQVPPVFFEPPLNVGAPNVTAIDAGDVNGDLRPDLVMAVNPPNPSPPPPLFPALLRIQLGTIGGDLAPPTFVNGTGLSPQAIVAEDLNQDGKADAVMSNFLASPSDLTVFFGDGLGSATVNTSLSAGPGAKALFVADLRNTSRRDILVADSSGNTITVFLDGGAATYTVGTNLGLPAATPVGITVGDFLNHHLNDIAVATGGTAPNVFILPATSPGVFGPAGPGLNADDGPSGIAAADFDLNGLVDLAVTSNTSQTVDIFLNSASGLPISPSSVIALPGPPTAIKAVDINGDGLPDLIVTCAGSSNTLNIFLGTGGGNFIGGPSIPVGSVPNSIAVADFDQDGQFDIAVNNRGIGSVMLFLQY